MIMVRPPRASSWPSRIKSADARDEKLRRLPLRRNELPVDQALGDLDGVERRALAQIVGDDPQHQAAVDGRVLADAADIGRVLAGAVVRRDVAAGLTLVDDDAAGRLAW